MKRIISAVSLILLLVAVFATPADASTGFTLADGVVEFTSSHYLQPEELIFSGKYWEVAQNNISAQNNDAASGKIEGRNGLIIEYAVEGLAVQSNNSFYPSAVIDGYPTGSQVIINFTFYGPYSIQGSWATDGSVRLNNEKLETVRAPDSNGAPGWSFSPKQVVVTITDEIRANGFVVSAFLGYARSETADSIWVTVNALKGNPPPTNPTEIVAPLVPPNSTFPDSGARFSDLSGQVEVLIPKGYKADGEPDWDEEAWTIAKLDMTLPEGTRIKTSDRSTVILSFADMTTFSMKPETEIWLSKPQAKPGQLKLLGGQLWINFKRMIKDGSMEIEMGQAVTGIKGTTLVLEDNGTTSTVKVIEGTVEVTAKADGKSQMVEAGSMLSADSQGFGELQTFDIAAESASWPQVAAIDAGNPSAAEPGEPDVVVLPYGADAEELAPDAAEAPAPRIGLILGIYFFVAVILVAAVVVIILLTRRKKRL